MSVSFKEVQGVHLITDIPIAHQQNIADLLKRVNRCQELVSARMGHYVPFKVTSGYRDAADQKRINPNAPRSYHLLGMAVDISDPDGKIKECLKNNSAILEECKLWCEDGAHTPTWCHMQSAPPRSGKRWFIP